MTKELNRFKLIEGGGKPKPYRKRRQGEIEPLICKCGSAASIEVKLGRMIRDGKPQGGTKQIRCADCGTVLI